MGSLILLKETLQLVPELGGALQDADSELLHAIGANCQHEVFKTLLATATQVLDEVKLHLMACSINSAIVLACRLCLTTCIRPGLRVWVSSLLPSL